MKQNRISSVKKYRFLWNYTVLMTKVKVQLFYTETFTVHTSGERKPHVARELCTVHYFLSLGNQFYCVLPCSAKFFFKQHSVKVTYILITRIVNCLKFRLVLSCNWN